MLRTTTSFIRAASTSAASTSAAPKVTFPREQLFYSRTAPPRPNHPADRESPCRSLSRPNPSARFGDRSARLPRRFFGKRGGAVTAAAMVDWEEMQRRAAARTCFMALRDDAAAPPKLAPGSPLPVLFLSHGSPMASVEESPLSNFWKLLGKQVRQLPSFRAVVVVSAHWEASPCLKVNATAAPTTVHDFYGFPDRLYQLQYPVKGSPEVAARVSLLLEANGFKVVPDGTHGLDHGAWVPLRWMLPDCPVPVVQLSLLKGGSADFHLRMGQALAPLRREGVLIVCSGSSVHNLMDFRQYLGTDRVAPYVEPFEELLDHAATERDNGKRRQLLLDLEKNPLFSRAHPTPEHIFPLHVAVGAAEEDVGRKVYGMSEMSLAYGSYAFGGGI